MLGTVYELSESDVRDLDRFEGVAQGNYRREMMTVDVDGQVLDCLVYIDYVTEEGEPKKEYVVRINKGIQDAGFPDGYVTLYLRPFVPAQPDV